MNVIEVLKQKARELDEPILSFLDEGKPENLMDACRHYPKAGGKRMRPVLAVTIADAVGGKGELALPYGAALEIIHNFTLVHDDVMDNDDTRRGTPAVHTVWGMPTAIIAGDALFARAFEIISDLDIPDADVRKVLRYTSRTVWELAEGQQMDMNNEEADAIDRATYIETVEKKTGALFGSSLAGGAIIGGADDELVKNAYDFGRQMGVAFQIQDDVLGLKGDQSKFGKPVGSDIRNGKKTLIVVDALERMPEGKERDALTAALGNADASDEQVQAAIAALESFGSIDRAEQAARDYVIDSKAKLAALPEGPDKDFLMALADYAISRQV